MTTIRLPGRRESVTQSGSPPAGWVLATPQREPRTFSATADEDVDEWFQHYQRVSHYNRWDNPAQLANVPFFLAGTALLWSENREDALVTWDPFVHELKR